MRQPRTAFLWVAMPVLMTSATWARSLEEECADGSPAACYERASSVWYVASDQQDYEQAVEAFGRSCTLGMVEGCNMALSIAAARGLDPGEQVVNRVHASCSRGVAASCVAMSRAASRGVGIPRSFVAGRRYLRRACDLDEAWCDELYVVPGGPWTGGIAALITLACSLILALTTRRRNVMVATGILALGASVLTGSELWNWFGGGVVGIFGATVPLVAVFAAILLRSKPWIELGATNSSLMPSSAADEGKDDAKKNEEGPGDDEAGK